MAEDKPKSGTEEDLASTATQPPSSQAGARRIGVYRLIQKVGEGGMGEVWQAEQTEPVRRRVALKIIKQGMDTRTVIARFEQERQALALMDHPCVAKVFDAGATPEGRPYFVMEYVQGLPISEHCDRHRLSTSARLALFGQVCGGVQHAHQKAIVHRDLKSSNVLVSIQDGKAVPTIIDFGVAKAITQRLTERSLFTELGVLVGTPEYMSPEQADLTAQDVDTRTDVYSLGVMLYELLVGALPFEPRELRREGVDGIRKMIREVEPPRPSARLSTLGAEKSTDSARQRRVDVSTLRRQLSGDLDWITMKALEKDRTRRYGSPAELAADIGRHLRHEPVTAGPPSTAYRARKFVRRHRFGVAATALGVTALLAFAVAMAIQADKIAREADSKARVAELLQDLFKVSDPGEARGGTITAREILDKGAVKIRESLTEDPTVRADMMATMGKIYMNLGLYEEAEPLLRDALETRRRLLGPDDPDTLRLANDMGSLHNLQGRFEEAETIHREVLEIQKRVLGPEHPDTLSAMHGVAAAHSGLGRYREAEALTRNVLEIRKRVLGPEHPDTLSSMSNVAIACSYQGRYQEAETLDREVVEIQKRVLGPDHPDTLRSMSNLAVDCSNQGRYQEAEALDREVFETSKRVLGPEHRDTLKSMRGLALDYRDLGRYQEAEALHGEVVEISKRVLGPEHPDTLRSMNDLAWDYLALERHQEAEALLSEVLEIRKRVLGHEHPETLRSMYTIAWAAHKLGRYKQAEVIGQQVLEIRKRVLGPEHPDTLWSMNSLAITYSSQGRYQEAEALHVEVFEIQERVFGPHHPDTLASIYNLGCMAAMRGDHARALSYLRDAVERGYARPWIIAEDEDLAILHGDPEFEAILALARENQEKQSPEE